MSIVFIDGFDHYPVEQIGYKWDSVVNAANLDVATTYGRYGSKGLRVGDNSAVGKVVLPNNKLILGFAFKVGSTMDTDQRVLCGFLSVGAFQFELRITNSNQLQVTRQGTAITGGIATSTLTPGVTYFCEVAATIGGSIAAGDCVVRIGGVTVISLPAGSNIAGAGGTTANAIQLGHGSRGLFVTNYVVDFDDLYLLDGSGTRNNGLIGDQRVELLLPNAAGTESAWSVVGAASAVAAVNDAVCDFDTGYISCSTPGSVQTFTYPNTSTVPNAVAGLQMTFMNRKDDAGTRVGAGVAKIAGTKYVGPTFGIADGYNIGRSVFENNPATGVAWTPTEINTLEAGVKLVV